MKKKITITFIALLGMGVPFLLQILRDHLYISREVDKFIAEPLFDFSLSIFVVSLLLLFVRETVFRSWLRFASWWVPLSILSIFVVGGGGGGFGLPSFGQEAIAIILSALFFLISLAIIAVKSWRLRKR